MNCWILLCVHILCNCPLIQNAHANTCDSLTFVNRTGWNGRAPAGTMSTLTRPVRGIVIHHTAGGFCSTDAQCEAKVREAQNHHMDRPDPWSDIGYHFLVGENGKVYEGRSVLKRGAHSPGNNAWTYGINVIGNYMERAPNQLALTAVKGLIECLIQRNDLVEDYGLFGHRDGRCTLCPGDQLYNEIRSWNNYGDRCDELQYYCSSAYSQPSCPLIPKASTPCTRQGNLMLLKPTGASVTTAALDHLSVSGVAASKIMVTMDKERLEQYKYCFDSAGPEYGVHPALIAAIVSRVSRGGSGLDVNGYTNNANDYGLMHCNTERHGLNCLAHSPYSCAHIRQMVAVLRTYVQDVARAHSSWTPQQHLQGAVAAYNFGVRYVQTWRRLDVGSTGNDFSSDIIARAQYIVSDFDWPCPLSSGAAIDPSLMNRGDARSYLTKYGFMGNGNLVDGLRLFQTWYHLKVTGEVDEATSSFMKQPRCQNRDIPNSNEQENNNRKRRYALLGTRWPRNEVSYFISNYPPASEISQQDVDSEIRRAFDLWTSVTPLNFSRAAAQNGADIIILFAQGQHGDGRLNAFDGTGGVLAHAYQPGEGIGGDTHFDDHETWTLKTVTGVNLYYVAVHEFGHALGLDHTNISQAVMFPTYSGYKPHLRLHSDDILGVQSMYGPPATADVNCKSLADSGNCEFYRNCVQAKVPSCDAQKDYPMAYGYKYCNQFTEHYERFTSQGKVWVDDVRKCLMNALLGYIYRPRITCKTIADVAFDSHVKCYLNSGPGFCAIILDNMDALCNVYDTGDFFGEYWKQAWKQVILTLHRCYSKWWQDQSLIRFATTDFQLGVATTACAVSKLGDYVEGPWSRTVSWFTDTWRDLFVDDSTDLDCRFWELFEYKFSCFHDHQWSFPYSFLLPLCVKFESYSGIGPSARVGRWMERTQQCLISRVLPAYRADSVHCMQTDSTLLYGMRSCMVESGFCEFDRADEFFLDRAINTKGFPAQFPVEYTKRPLSGKTERLESEYFLQLRWFKSLLTDANIMCYQRGQRAEPSLYTLVENTEFNIPVRMRTEL